METYEERQLWIEINRLKDKVHRRNAQLKAKDREIEELKGKVPKIEFTGRRDDLNDCDWEEIARLIKEGYTSGRLNDEEKNIYWELQFNVWKD